VFAVKASNSYLFSKNTL